MSFTSSLVTDFTMQTNAEGYQALIDEVSSMRRNEEDAKINLQKIQKVDLDKLLKLEYELENLDDVLMEKGLHPIKKVRANRTLKNISKEISDIISNVAMPINDTGEKYYFPYQHYKWFNFRDLSRILAEIRKEISRNEYIVNNTAAQIKEKVDDFSIEEMRRYCDQGFDIKDMEEVFSEKNLSSLSLGDYLATLGRYPGDVLTHVTRQGVRDHTGMIWHTAGVGENHDGFKGILRRGKLLSTLQTEKERGMDLPEALGACLARYRLPQVDDETTDKYSMKIREEMLYHFNRAIENPNEETSSIGGHFGDLFDKTSVHFGVSGVLDHLYGSEKGNECFLVFPQAMAIQTEYQGTLFQWEPTSYHNDVGLLPKDGEGFSIEAALIFIPKNAQVDPQTGSKYKIINGKAVEIGKDGEGNMEYALAEQTISSEEYWGKFISENCRGQQLKVVYYDTGFSPTEALRNFLSENGLAKEMKNGMPTDSTERKKYEILKETEKARQEDFISRDMAVKTYIKSVIDESVVENAINEHFDILEKDPKGTDMLRQRIEYLHGQGNYGTCLRFDDTGRAISPPIETMEQNHTKRLSEIARSKELERLNNMKQQTINEQTMIDEEVKDKGMMI